MPNNNFTEDQNFKLGISLVIVLLVVLLIIFAVYAFRSKQGTVNEVNDQTSEEGFFSRLFGNSNEQVNNLDSDKDGLFNEEEQRAGTDSLKADSDSDGLTDREEKLVYKTDPIKDDSDNDGIKDGEEIKNRRDPKNSDPKAEWPPRPAQFTTASN